MAFLLYGITNGRKDGDSSKMSDTTTTEKSTPVLPAAGDGAAPAATDAAGIRGPGVEVP